MVVEDCVVGTACAVLWVAVTSNEVLLTNMVAAGVIVGGVIAGVVSLKMVTCVGDTCAVGAVVVLKRHGMDGSSRCSGDSGLDRSCGAYRQTDRPREQKMFGTHTHTHCYVQTTDRQLKEVSEMKRTISTHTLTCDRRM